MNVCDLPAVSPVAERITLQDGRLITLRSITPAAKPLIVKAVAGLSPETSRRRLGVSFGRDDDHLVADIPVRAETAKLLAAA